MKNLFRLIPSLAFAAILVLRTSGKFVDTEFSQSDQVRAALYAFLSLDEVKLHKVNDAFDISQSAKFWGCDDLIKSNKRIMKPDELQKVVAALMLEVIVKMPPEHLDCLRQLQLDREEIFGHIKDQRLETVTALYNFRDIGMGYYNDVEADEESGRIAYEAGKILDLQSDQAYKEAQCFWKIFEQIKNQPEEYEYLTSKIESLKSYNPVVDVEEIWNGFEMDEPTRFDFELLLERQACFLTQSVQKAMKPDRSQMCNLWGYNQVITEHKRITGIKNTSMRRQLADYITEKLPAEERSWLDELVEAHQPARAEAWVMGWNRCVKACFEPKDETLLDFHGEDPNPLDFEECGQFWGAQEEDLCTEQIKVFVTIHQSLMASYPELLFEIKQSRKDFGFIKAVP